MSLCKWCFLALQLVCRPTQAEVSVDQFVAAIKCSEKLSVVMKSDLRDASFVFDSSVGMYSKIAIADAQSNESLVLFRPKGEVRYYLATAPNRLKDAPPELEKFNATEKLALHPICGSFLGSALRGARGFHFHKSGDGDVWSWRSSFSGFKKTIEISNGKEEVKKAKQEVCYSYEAITKGGRLQKLTKRKCTPDKQILEAIDLKYPEFDSRFLSVPNTLKIASPHSFPKTWDEGIHP